MASDQRHPSSVSYSKQAHQSTRSAHVVPLNASDNFSSCKPSAHSHTQSTFVQHKKTGESSILHNHDARRQSMHHQPPHHLHHHSHKIPTRTMDVAYLKQPIQLKSISPHTQVSARHSGYNQQNEHILFLQPNILDPAVQVQDGVGSVHDMKISTMQTEGSFLTSKRDSSSIVNVFQHDKLGGSQKSENYESAPNQILSKKDMFDESADSPPIQQSDALDLELDPAIDELEDAVFQYYGEGDNSNDYHTQGDYDQDSTVNTNFEELSNGPQGSNIFQNERRTSFATTASVPSTSLLERDVGFAGSFAHSSRVPTSSDQDYSLSTVHRTGSMTGVSSTASQSSHHESNKPLMPCSDLAAKLSGYPMGGESDVQPFNSTSQSFSNSPHLQSSYGKSLWSNINDSSNVCYSSYTNSEKQDIFGNKMLSEYFFQIHEDSTYGTDLASNVSSIYSSASSSAWERYQVSEQELGCFDPVDSDRLGPFELQKVLGKGTSATVRAARHTETGFEVAVKILTKHSESSIDVPPQPAEAHDSTDAAPVQRNFMSKIRRETAILKLFDHPNVLKLFDVFETDQYAFLVLERANRGELFELITKQGRLDVLTAKLLLAQLIQALRHCHKFGVAHRDVKPENVLLDQHYVAKLCDFGMAKSFAQANSNDTADSQTKQHTGEHGEPLLTTACGSPHYASPELLKGLPYDGCKSDTWSLGIVAYALVTGSLPFDAPKLSTLFQIIIRGEFFIPNFVPEDYASLIRAMLDTNPQTRITLEEVVSHPCFSSATSKLSYLFATPSSAAEAAMLLSEPSFPLRSLRPEPEWHSAVLSCPKTVSLVKQRVQGIVPVPDAASSKYSSMDGNLNLSLRTFSDSVDGRASPWEFHQTTTTRQAEVESSKQSQDCESLSEQSMCSDTEDDAGQFDECNPDDVDKDDIIQVVRPQLVPIRRIARYGRLVPDVETPMSPFLCNIKAVTISPQLTQRRSLSSQSPIEDYSTILQNRVLSPLGSPPQSSQFLRMKRSSNSSVVPPAKPTSLSGEASILSKQCSAARTLLFSDQIVQDSNCNPVQRLDVSLSSVVNASNRRVEGRDPTVSKEDYSLENTIPNVETMSSTSIIRRARAWSCDVDSSYTSSQDQDSSKQVHDKSPLAEPRDIVKSSELSDAGSSVSIVSHSRKSRMQSISLHYEQRSPSPAESFVLQTTNLYSLAPPLRTRQAGGVSSVSSSSASTTSASPQFVRTADASPFLMRANSEAAEFVPDLPKQSSDGMIIPISSEMCFENNSPLLTARSSITTRAPGSAPRPNKSSYETPYNTPNSHYSKAVSVGIGVSVGAYNIKAASVHDTQHSKQNEQTYRSLISDIFKNGGNSALTNKTSKVASSRVLLFSPIHEKANFEPLPSTGASKMSGVLTPISANTSIQGLSLMSSKQSEMENHQSQPVIVPPVSVEAISSSYNAKPEEMSPMYDPIQHLSTPMPIPLPLPNVSFLSRRNSTGSRFGQGASFSPSTNSIDTRKERESYWFAPTLPIDELTVLDLSALGWGSTSSIRTAILNWHRKLYDFELKQIKAGESRVAQDNESNTKFDTKNYTPSAFYSPLPTMPFTIVRGKGSNGATAPMYTSTRTTKTLSAVNPCNGDIDNTSNGFMEHPSPVNGQNHLSTPRGDQAEELPDSHFSSNNRSVKGAKIKQNSPRSPQSFQSKNPFYGKSFRGSDSKQNRARLTRMLIPEALKDAPRVVFYYYLLLKRKRRRLRRLCKISPRVPPTSPSSASKSLTLARVVVKEEVRDEVDDWQLLNEEKAPNTKPIYATSSLTPSLFPKTLISRQKGASHADRIDDMTNPFETSGMTPYLRPLSLSSATPPTGVPGSRLHEKVVRETMSCKLPPERLSSRTQRSDECDHVEFSSESLDEISNFPCQNDYTDDRILVPGIWDSSPRDSFKKIRWNPSSVEPSSSNQLNPAAESQEMTHSLDEQHFAADRKQFEGYSSTPTDLKEEEEQQNRETFSKTPSSSPPRSARASTFKPHRSPIYASLSKGCDSDGLP